ncbi:glycosyltransferase family 2 protein [Paragemmobacter ruber]|uniref:Glycosyltransferase family 92 protein n=1 Tax=Paragemmobacter ruber TaxID=1985673 RepID=A0ABW9Y0V9_9RHOB|nr:glycosyltransferase family 2 protein [Rhodobacter ruber]NBE06143.1 glycosyltransferase family 92 protein [Rhodobacter ruber]
MKNESISIDEWIEHYLWVGAHMIYLIDNGSTDDTLQKARQWEKGGRVRVIELPEKYKQTQHYWTAIKHFKIKQNCDWLLVADLDEYWFCPSGDSIPDALREFSNFDVIYSNWVMFGSGGFVEQPESVRMSFVLRKPGVNWHINTKYMCRTSVLKRQSSVGIHKVKGADSSRTVSDITRFQLNHYPIQSLSFFTSVKMTRGDAATPRHEHVRDMEYFRRYDEGCTEVDRKLADLVKEKMPVAGP